MKYKEFNKAFIYNGSEIGEGVHIGVGSIIYPNVRICDNTHIGSYSIIGEPSSSYYSDKKSYEFKKTHIGNNSVIRSHSIIYNDVTIGSHFSSGHRITIREASIIKEQCSIGTLSDLQGKLTIGRHVRIHSNVHIGQLSNIGDFVWVYPYVVLTNDPYPPMGKLSGVTIKNYAQIATSAVILPGIIVGENALVGAHSLVTKNVAKERVVVGNPARDICAVQEITDKNNKQIYPWKKFLRDYRGYPWQKKSD
jgi:acetyltransferase-like isoleucine patch superfamily enzyme